MESSDKTEKKYKVNKKMQKYKKNQDPGLTQEFLKIEEGERQPIASQPSTSRERSDVVVNLKQRTKNVSDKLVTKRKLLEIRKSHLENKKEEKNKMKHLKALQDVDVVHGTELPEEILPARVNSNENIVKPLDQHSKKQLRSLVEGLQELVCKLTVGNFTLRKRAKEISSNIRGLKNFDIFSNVESSSSTSKRKEKCHKDKIKYESRPKEQNRSISEKKENEKVSSSRKTFVNYINSILSKYFGAEQQDKIEKYKCLPSHLDDLESFANTLVEANVGGIVETEIHINRKNNRQSFVRGATDGGMGERDGIILNPVARRYAFDGDIVQAFILHPTSAVAHSNNDTFSVSRKNPEKSSSEENILSLVEDEEILVDSKNPKAFVIKLVTQTELREVVGVISILKPRKLSSKLYYTLRPNDFKVPMVYIPYERCAEEIKNISKTDICGMLYLARILETDINGHCIGELVHPVGKVGNLQAEMKAILLQNGLKDTGAYDRKFHEIYETLTTVTDEDLKNREDLRTKCVFTIDPLTAKDLDDALSVEKLTDIEYEIGVHISDVSFYLEENSELDNLVKLRATSIYLVNEVIHMLPTSLCFKCSLLPGEDKFTFSVFWKWNTQNKELSAPRFTRSIINSCSQFAYEHAQKIIDNPAEEFDIDDFPGIQNNWTPKDIQWRVLFLHNIAQMLKSKRFANGSLSINNPKLRFQLDPKTGEPLEYEIEDRKEANFLIEEFMLLANQSVAEFVHDKFPDISILRNHSPPKAESMIALKKRLSSMGLKFDISTSKSVCESMNRICQAADDPQAMNAWLNVLLTKPMTRARYYCSEGKTSDVDFWHYALSLPIYTHFTSPIRRYPDIMVQRLLGAALNYCPPPQRSTDELHHLCNICNDQKWNAKKAGDASIELFFKRYVTAKQSIRLKAFIIEILNYLINVVTIETGHALQIVFKNQKVLMDTTNAPVSINIFNKGPQLPPIKLELFGTVDVDVVVKKGNLCCYFATPDIS